MVIKLLDEFDQFQQTPKVEDGRLDAQVLESGWWRLVGPLERDGETAIRGAPQA